MSNSVRAVFVLGLVALAAGCAPKPEPVAPLEPVSVEPAYTGKYK